MVSALLVSAAPALPATEHEISNTAALLNTNRWQKELSPEFIWVGFFDVKNEFYDFKDN